MSREFIKPVYLTASIQEIARGYPPMALMRESGRVSLVGEDTDANTHLRHLLTVLPTFYPLQSFNKGFPKWMRHQITRAC